jgi:DNA-binding transcriptional ArsR family regulator
VVSIYLRVLREVGLVEVPDEDRQRRYRLSARPLKPIHDWVGTYVGLLATPRAVRRPASARER